MELFEALTVRSEGIVIASMVQAASAYTTTVVMVWDEAFTIDQIV
jgi:hypothetical protein